MNILLPRRPQRILIIKPSAIGDVVHTLPILSLLRKRFPDAHIGWIVNTSCSGILENHPLIDEVIHFERQRFGQGWRNPKAAVGLYSFMQRLKRGRWDLVIDLQGLFRSGWMAWRTGAPARVGFANAREFGSIFYTHRIAVRSMEQHAIERYLSIAEALGCGRGPVEFVFATSDATRAQVAPLLPAEPFAVLFPGTVWETKRWPVENFAQVTKDMRQRWGLKIVVMGAPNEVPLAQQVDADVDLTGQTTVAQMVAILERAAVVVANDSGPMHVAAALGRPLVTLFGPTNPARTGPYARLDTVLRLDIPCSPCYSRTCSHQSCLRQLHPDDVLEAVERQLSGAIPLPLLQPNLSK